MKTRHCWKCGWTYPLGGQPGRTESCHQCSADLKVCRNCIHFDPRLAHQCKERRADPVGEKEIANFCEHFEMAVRDYESPDGNPRENQARANLRNLLGD